MIQFKTQKINHENLSEIVTEHSITMFNCRIITFMF